MILTSAAKILRRFLVTQRIVTYPSQNLPWPAYTNKIPDEGSTTIGMFDVDGRWDGRNMRTGKNLDHPGVSLLFRADEPDDAYHKAAEIATAFENCFRKEVVVESNYMIWAIHQLRGITPIANRATEKQRVEVELLKGRQLFTLNVICTIIDLSNWLIIPEGNLVLPDPKASFQNQDGGAIFSIPIPIQ